MGNVIKNKIELIADNPEDIRKVIEYVTASDIHHTVIYDYILKAVSVYLSNLNPSNKSFNSGLRLNDTELFYSIYKAVKNQFPSNRWDDIKIFLTDSDNTDVLNNYFISLGKIITTNTLEYNGKSISYSISRYDKSVITDSQIVFYTIWTPDLPVTRTLSFIFPNVTFKHSYTDEDNFAYDCGYMVFKNGALIDDKKFEENSKEAHEFSAWVMEKTLEELFYKWNEKLQEYEFDWDAFESE